MSDVKKFLDSCFKEPPTAIKNLLNYISVLQFDTTPDYRKVHSILLAGLKEAGGTLGQPLVFSIKRTPKKRNGATVISESSPKQPKKGQKKLLKFKEKEAKSNSSTEENKEPADKKSKKEEKKNGDKYEGYTAAMVEIAEKRQKKGKVEKAAIEPIASTSSEINDTKRSLRTKQPVVYYNSDGDTPKPVRKRKK